MCYEGSGEEVARLVHLTHRVGHGAYVGVLLSLQRGEGDFVAGGLLLWLVLPVTRLHIITILLSYHSVVVSNSDVLLQLLFLFEDLGAAYNVTGKVCLLLLAFGRHHLASAFLDF